MTIKCNIHPLDERYLWVVDTPYYAISHSDTLDGKDKWKRAIRSSALTRSRIFP